MKRITLIILALLCAAQVFAQNGVIKEFAGTVELKRAGQADFVPAKPGDTVAKDTVISTGFKSTALVSVGNTILTVRPLTRLTLAEISASADSETLNINIQTGRVRVDVKPPAGTKAHATVSSPIVTASVRGTSFEFDTQRLSVLEGTVVFAGNRGGLMLVSTGSTSEVRDNGRVADPIETYAAELLPPPVAGSDSGFNRGSSVVFGEFNFIFEIRKVQD